MTFPGAGAFQLIQQLNPTGSISASFPETAGVLSYCFSIILKMLNLIGLSTLICNTIIFTITCIMNLSKGNPDRASTLSNAISLVSPEDIVTLKDRQVITGGSYLVNPHSIVILNLFAPVSLRMI